MEKYNRKANRLPEFDYGEVGCYFITLCTHDRASLFVLESPVVGNGLCAVPSENTNYSNQLIHEWIQKTQIKFSNIVIEKHVIMPDHLHLIVNIMERHVGRSLPDIMRYFKTMTTNAYIQGVKDGKLPSFNKKLWQKSYYDHIIRNQQDYNATWEYIVNNPLAWQLKHENIDL